MIILKLVMSAALSSDRATLSELAIKTRNGFRVQTTCPATAENIVSSVPIESIVMPQVRPDDGVLVTETLGCFALLAPESRQPASHPLVDILAQAKRSKNQASNCANAGN